MSHIESIKIFFIYIFIKEKVLIWYYYNLETNKYSRLWLNYTERVVTGLQLIKPKNSVILYILGFRNSDKNVQKSTVDNAS